MDEILIEEIHLSAYVPRRMPANRVRIVRQALAGTRFLGQLRRIVLDATKSRKGLGDVRWAVTR